MHLDQTFGPCNKSSGRFLVSKGDSIKRCEHFHFSPLSVHMDCSCKTYNICTCSIRQKFNFAHSRLRKFFVLSFAFFGQAETLFCSTRKESSSLALFSYSVEEHDAQEFPFFQPQKRNSVLLAQFWTSQSPTETHSMFSSQYNPMIAMPTSLDGRRSLTKKLIMLSDLMSRLQPKKKTPKITVKERTQRTAIWTTRVMKRFLSSGSRTDAPPSLATTVPVPLQQPIKVLRSWDRLEYTPSSTSV